MKKSLTTLLAALAVCFAANAQFYAGGMAGISLQNIEAQTNFNLRIAPEAGFHINDRIDLGLAISMSVSPSAYSSEFSKNTITNCGFYASPYFRYHFTNFGNVKLFAEGQPEFGFVTRGESGKISNQATNEWTKYRYKAGVGFAWGINFSAGATVEITDHVGLVLKAAAIGVNSTPTFKVNQLTNTMVTTSTGNYFNINLLNSLAFGLFYNF